ERRLELPVPASEPLIGIKPLFEDVVPDGQDARFQLIAIPGPEEAAPLKATWTLNRIETRYQWYQLYGNWNWEPTTRRTRIATGEITLGRDPVELAQPVEWGEYELVVEHEGQSYVASSSLFHAGWYVPADGADTPDRLDVSLDRESYQPGDAARLRLNARNGGMAMISVVSDQLISRQLIEVSAGETLIPLTVTEEWGSGAYVTAALVQPLQGKADQTPVRALGVVHAVVERPGQKLAVSIDVPDVARPRTTQLTRVTVEGARAGEDVWLTVAAVDLGILNLTGFRSPDPVGYFYGQRRLGVELRDLYGRLIETGNGALGVVRSGGDAGSGMQMQSPPPTQDLMAVFSGPLKVAADGTVDVPIDLPPFNGTVRLMAVAWTQSAVGQAEQDMLVRDPIVVSASAPRFLAPGDQSRILIDLTHADGPSGEVSVAARVLGDGLALGNLPSRVVLAEQGSQSL
ncbi:MAG: alpha-2-macroglobulin family protein, partial [Pseudomonadota bacterium]|nr:alpha-2-macroglobulin family protein [Pseudomonadota bacterium]